MFISLLFALILPSCGVAKHAPSAEMPMNDPELVKQLDDSPGAVVDPGLRALLREHWAWSLERSPRGATMLGVHAYDARLEAHGLQAEARDLAAIQAFLDKARAIDPAALSPGDRLELELFRLELENSVAEEGCHFSRWAISARSNPVSDWNDLPEQHQVTDLGSGRSYVARVHGVAATVRGDLELLIAGGDAGLYPSAESARRVIVLFEDQLAKPVAEWPMAAPAAALAQIDGGQALAQELLDALETEVRPAFVSYRDFVVSRVLPHARSDEQPGLSSLPGGADCYAARVRSETSLALSPQEIHDIGLAEIERIDGELRALGQRLFGTDKLPEILNHLRSDPALYFTSEQEVEDFARATLEEANAKVGEVIGHLPRTTCAVSRMPDFEAKYTTIAYYRPAYLDGSKPGEYVVNTTEPTTRPRYEARVLAVHEGVPGHHIQVSLAQELPAAPAFRRNGGVNAFVEGWALYTERLAEEMGLYHDDLDRMGMLSFDAWRASRLVVDTGLHALGWSREQAKQFMTEHTALAANNIDNEVDRYVVWPGQALSYKLGQLEMLRLRSETEARLGARFDLRAYHDLVLGAGALPLGALRERVEAWPGP